MRQDPRSHDLLAEAEELERSAAEGRAVYLAECLDRRHLAPRSILDVGCGNGYAVSAWRRRGLPAFGVDLSLYRLSRWAVAGASKTPLVVADAAWLPFASESFDAVTSSGMIEHVGVSESSAPYTVSAHADQAGQRAAVVQELGRVARRQGLVILDCPNGAFPIDFWHGDRLGAVRFHPRPDPLLPSFGDLSAWGQASGWHATLEPLHDRLKFRQISRRWWGRLLAPCAALYLRGLDLLVAAGWWRLPARFYPYLVVSFRR